jgi:hypothetical protein
MVGDTEMAEQSIDRSCVDQFCLRRGLGLDVKSRKQIGGWRLTLELADLRKEDFRIL